MTRPCLYSIFIFVFGPLYLFAQPTGELFFSDDYPMGNVAVTKAKGDKIQYFYSIHPEAKPTGARIFEIREGVAYPFPDSSFQENFISPLGVYLDMKNRLWVLDHGNYAHKGARLFAFDATNGKLLVDYPFPRNIVRKWVMLNDLTVSPDGNYVIISAPGMFKKRSSIIVFDVVGKTARRVLTDHPSVMRKKLLPEVDGKKMRFILGLIKVRPGVDGIDIDPWGKYVYYTAMADTLVYKIPLNAITDPMLGDEELNPLIQRIGKRPLCDGIRVDEKKLVYLTDFQHQQVISMDPDGLLTLVLENKMIRWADGLSIGSDGYLYVTDSALQHVILKKKKKYMEKAPFGIWRIRIKAK